jgi:hypothetical protein
MVEVRRTDPGRRTGAGPAGFRARGKTGGMI